MGKGLEDRVDHLDGLHRLSLTGVGHPHHGVGIAALVHRSGRALGVLLRHGLVERLLGLVLHGNLGKSVSGLLLDVVAFWIVLHLRSHVYLLAVAGEAVGDLDLGSRVVGNAWVGAVVGIRGDVVEGELGAPVRAAGGGHVGAGDRGGCEFEGLGKWGEARPEAYAAADAGELGGSQRGDDLPLAAGADEDLGFLKMR